MEGPDAQRDATESDRSHQDELRHILRSGWQNPSGHAFLDRLSKLCEDQAHRWARSAGWLGQDGHSELWEYVNGLLLKGYRIDMIMPAAALKAARIYAQLAAAAQTGMGSSSSPKLVALARSAGPLRRDDILSVLQSADQGRTEAPPRWLHLGGTMLDAAGWAWPVPATPALEAAAACGAVSRSRGGTGRQQRSPLARHKTGVPPNTWSSLELLALGSSPMCNPDHRWPGIILMTEAMDDEQLRSDRHVKRIVAAAVAGRAVRTGRRLSAQ